MFTIIISSNFGTEINLTWFTSTDFCKAATKKHLLTLLVLWYLVQHTSGDVLFLGNKTFLFPSLLCHQFLCFWRLWGGKVLRECSLAYQCNTVLRTSDNTKYFRATCWKDYTTDNPASTSLNLVKVLPSAIYFFSILNVTMQNMWFTWSMMKASAQSHNWLINETINALFI